MKGQRRLDEAVACYRRALELKPDYAEAYSNLGDALKDQGRVDKAVACCRRALELKPDFAEAHSNLGTVLKDQGRLDEAVACYRRALELKPDYVEAHSNLLLTLQYCAGTTPAALAEAHAEYDRRHAAALSCGAARHANIRHRHERLRLGFASPDLGRHPVGYFLVRVLENLSQDEYEITCYSDRIVKDNVTHCLQSAVTQWRDVVGMKDARLAEQIRADQIDILFDLAGHTAHNRLLVFARKPAPIQVTWMGYTGTTGLAAMDYLLADRYEVPEGMEGFCRERVLRMPDGYVCFQPPSDSPAVSPLPAVRQGRITFASFNNPAKITREVLKTWAQVLRRVAGSRLILKYQGIDESTVRRRLLDAWTAEGLAAERLELQGPAPRAELLGWYNRVDVALDTFPYNGGLTTCEALWMGVPVITCPGETFASRHSLSHLSNVGLTETIARDLEEYVEIAVSLANNLPRLAAIRGRLRDQMSVSPLCDGPRFARNLMALLRDVWRRWCEGANGGQTGVPS